MKELTRKILDEEFKKFFPEINGSFNVSSLNEGYEGESGKDIYDSVKLRVLPGYSEWRKTLKRLPTFYDGATTPGWAMHKYIHQTMGLARALLENNYPVEEILGVLPRDFSEKVAERLR